MKKRRTLNIILAAIISVISPFVLSFTIQGLCRLSDNLGLETLFIFENINIMKYTDYLSIIISIYALMASVWLGINTYKISYEIKNHEEEKERRELEKAKRIIQKEIESNTTIIKKHNENITSNLQSLQVQGQEEISKLILYTNATNSDLVTNLYEVYVLYSKIKNSNDLSKVEYNESKVTEIKKEIGGLEYEQTKF